MALQEHYDVGRIRNLTAEYVYRRVEEELAKRSDVCKCESCVLDLIGFTLNRVTPRYAVSMLGELNPSPRKTRRLELETDLAIRAGIDRLKKHPHHD